MSSGTPKTSGIVLYCSSVAGSVAVEKNMDRVRFLLTAGKYQFTEIDISLAENTVDKEYMHKNSGAKSKLTIPQLFVNGKYIGTKDEIEEANEFGELKELLGVN